MSMISTIVDIEYSAKFIHSQGCLRNCANKIQWRKEIKLRQKARTWPQACFDYLSLLIFLLATFM